MSSLNVPSYIPSVGVSKEPKAWEKVLLSLLASAGSAAVGQGVQNAMSRDYATEFGKTPATGFGKLLQGPAVGDRQASDIRSQMTDKARLESAEKQSRLNRLTDMTRSNREMQGQTERQTADLQARIAEMQSADARAERGEVSRERLATLDEKGRNLRAMIDAEMKKREMAAGEPERTAKTRSYNANAADQELMTKLKSSPVPSQGTPAINPNVAKFVQSTQPMSDEDAGIIAIVKQALESQPTAIPQPASSPRPLLGTSQPSQDEVLAKILALIQQAPAQ